MERTHHLFLPSIRSRVTGVADFWRHPTLPCGQTAIRTLSRVGLPDQPNLRFYFILERSFLSRG